MIRLVDRAEPYIYLREIAMPDLGYPMIPANVANWSPGRSADIRWIVVHCTDTPYQDNYPTRLGQYWSRSPVQTSTHYGVSDTEVRQYVAHADTAYAAREPGNSRGMHIEFAGLSRWSRAQWLAHDPMLRRGALLIKQIAARHGLPPDYRLTKEKLIARKPGVTCHADLTATFSGTHTDPGAGFPWDVLFRYIAAAPDEEDEDDMGPTTVFNVPKLDGSGALEPKEFKVILAQLIGKQLELQWALEGLGKKLDALDAKE